uniref:HNH nuclease domain-containing protein n=1 Tax=viral metagenome TaxID=1070528 RepID=A0A6M3K6B9_9ZZZZ
MKNKCIDCGKEIYKDCKRCKSCSNKEIANRKETKNKLRILLSGTNNPMYGKHHTEETKKRIGLANSGENNFWFGKKRPDFSERLRSNNPNKNGLTEETKLKLSLKAKERFKDPKNHPNYINGKNIRNEKYSDCFDINLKKDIRKRDNYTCQNCNMTEEEHLIVYGFNLTVHHIDYNKQNSVFSNLISLCSSCHMRTNFNRSYWESLLRSNINV